MTERTKWIKKLDKKWSETVKQRDGKCLRCYKTVNLQSAHIFLRRHLGTRWDKNNGITLCAGCHLFWGHQEP